MKTIILRRIALFLTISMSTALFIPLRSEGKIVTVKERYIRILNPEDIYLGALIELEDLNKRVPRIVPNPNPKKVYIMGPLFDDLYETEILATKKEMQDHMRFVGEHYGNKEKHTVERFIAGGNSVRSFAYFHILYGQVVDLKHYLAVNPNRNSHKTIRTYTIRRWFYTFEPGYIDRANYVNDPILLKRMDKLGIVDQVIFGRDAMFIVCSNQEDKEVKLALEGAIRHGSNKIDDKAKALLYTSEIRVENYGKAQVTDSPLLNPIDLIMAYVDTLITKQDYGIPTHMMITPLDPQLSSFFENTLQFEVPDYLLKE